MSGWCPAAGSQDFATCRGKIGRVFGDAGRALPGYLLLCLAAIDRQIHGELGALGTSREGDLAAVLRFDDAACDVQAEPGPAADRLGGEEGLKDMFLVLFGDAGAVVGKADGDTVPVALGADGDFAALRRSVDGIVQQVGPHLVQSSGCIFKRRQIGGKVFSKHDCLMTQLVAEDDQGAVQAFMDVECATNALALVSIFLYRDDEVGDAGNARLNGGDELDVRDDGFEPVESVRKILSFKNLAGTCEPVRIHTTVGEAGSNGPWVFDSGFLEPFGQSFLAIGLFE